MFLIKICDFGCSEFLDEKDRGPEELRQAGTLHSRAPEQNTGSKIPITEKIDIYALSGLGYTILSKCYQGKDTSHRSPIMLLQLLELCRSDDPEKRPSAKQIIGVLDELDLTSCRDLVQNQYNQLKEQELPIPTELQSLYNEMA